MNGNAKYERFATAVVGAWTAEPMKAADIHKYAGSNEALMDTPAFKKDLVKLAAEALKDSVTPYRFLFEKLASAEWDDRNDVYADVVFGALGRMSKYAFPIVAAAHDKLGGGVLKTLISAGVLGGAGAGSLAFLLGRDAEESSAENANILEKVRAFRELQREIEEDESLRAIKEQSKKEQSNGRFNIR